MAAKRYSSTNGHFGPFRILGDTDDQAACDLPWLCPRDSSMAFSVKPRLHDTTCCQRVVKPGLTTGWMFVYTIKPVVNPVVQPVFQPVVSCKRGFSVR